MERSEMRKGWEEVGKGGREKERKGEMSRHLSRSLPIHSPPVSDTVDRQKKRQIKTSEKWKTRSFHRSCTFIFHLTFPHKMQRDSALSFEIKMHWHRCASMYLWIPTYLSKKEKKRQIIISKKSSNHNSRLWKNGSTLSAPEAVFSLSLSFSSQFYPVQSGLLLLPRSFAFDRR